MKKGIDYIGVGAGAMIFNSDGKILLIKRGFKSKNEKGKWNIPGGSLEFGETREEAIKREIKEELDIEIEILDTLDTIDHIIPDEKQHWITTTFIAKTSGKPKIMEPEKISEIGWFALDKMPEPLTLSLQKDCKIYFNKFGKKAPFSLNSKKS